jgi:serum/glucocorticoid-regulated kinase 2
LKIDFRPVRGEPLQVTIEAFDLLKVIGKGSFGKVMQVCKKDTQRIYALKTIRKIELVRCLKRELQGNDEWIVH